MRVCGQGGALALFECEELFGRGRVGGGLYAVVVEGCNAGMHSHAGAWERGERDYNETWGHELYHAGIGTKWEQWGHFPSPKGKPHKRLIRGPMA